VNFRKAIAIGNEHIGPGSYAVLSVKDTGTGMSKEVQESIFEPFFSTKEVGKGTGMGLSTVYGVVKQHEGYITVHSTLGEGTVFKVYVPTTDREIEENADVAVNDLTGDETILAVDDEPLLIGLVVEMLEPLGYRILVASNGEEALKVCNDFKGRIDLLLTDVIMPGMNGRELAEKFIVKRPETKVIFMSGYTDDAIAHHGVLEEGIVLVNKPLKSSILAKEIREVLDADLHKSANQSIHDKLNGINILLADDNDDIRKLIQVYLKDYACNTDTAENGEIAVEKFKLGRYDLVLMDMQMPVMDGLTATRHIREWEDETGPGQTKIVALTGNAAQEEIDKCLHAGCSYHLAKPIKKDALVNALVSNISVMQSYVRSSEEIQEEKEERFVAHVDTDLKDLIPEYLEERQNDMTRIQEAMKAQDYETVRILGHTLKGSGGGYGFDPITEIGAHIEGAAKEANEEEIEKWNNKLSDYIQNIEIIYE
jgi:CheY-like chemotaxis protein